MLDPLPCVFEASHSRREIPCPVAGFDGVQGILFRDGFPFRGESSGQDCGHPTETGRTVVEHGVVKFRQESIDGELERRDGRIEDTEAFS